MEAVIFSEITPPIYQLFVHITSYYMVLKQVWTVLLTKLTSFTNYIPLQFPHNQ